MLQSLCDEVNDGQPAQRVWPFVADVTDTKGARAIFDQIATAMQGLDTIIYSAGVMPSVELDQFDPDIDRHIIEVNVIGAMTWLDLAAERFLAQGTGTIVGIGSVAGDRGRIKSPAYCASKAALHTFLESLRNRLARHGVDVITVKPGPVRTPMTEGLDKLPMVIEAEDAARSIVKSIGRRTGTVYVPAQWAPIMTVIRFIPSVVFRRMSI